MPSLPQNNPPPANSITALYQALVGPLSQPYYLARFTRFDDIGRSFPTWNWAGGMLTLNWLLFRGLWGWALAYAGAALGAALAVFGVGKLVLGFTDDTLHALLGVCLAAAFLVPGMYANAWYHQRSKRQLAEAILATNDNQQAAQRLASLAPSPKRLGLLALGNAVVLAPLVALFTLSWQLPHDGKLPAFATPTVAAKASAPAAPASMALRPASATLAATAAAVASAPLAAPSAPASATATGTTGRSDGGSIALAPEPAASTAPHSAPNPAPAASKALASTAAPLAMPAVAPAARASLPAVAPTPAAVNSGKASPAPVPATATPRPRPAEKARAQQFFVDAGIYAQAGNAKRAIDSLREAQLPVLADELDMVRGVRTRVRVGPYTNRADAEQAAQKVKGLGLPALVEARASNAP